MDSTSQLKIGLCRQATERERDDVMELQAAGLGALAFSADEGAPSLIAGPDGPTDMSWHMPLRLTQPVGSAARHQPRSGNRANFRAFGLLQ